LIKRNLCLFPDLTAANATANTEIWAKEHKLAVACRPLTEERCMQNTSNLENILSLDGTVAK